MACARPIILTYTYQQALLSETMSMKTPDKDNNLPHNGQHTAAVGDPDQVDKIRDILFGGQMRTFEQRFGQFDERIGQETSRLRDEMNQRNSAIEALLRKELSSLGERLQQERSSRDDALAALSDRLDQRITGLDAHLDALNERVAREFSEIRGQLHSQQQELSSQLQQRTDELEQALRRSSETLDDVKLGRSDLAALFTEVSLRLNRELTLPDTDAGS